MAGGRLIAIDYVSVAVEDASPCATPAISTMAITLLR
jgi:hypothetical protein